jgi:hypothetical protein
LFWLNFWLFKDKMLIGWLQRLQILLSYISKNWVHQTCWILCEHSLSLSLSLSLSVSTAAKGYYNSATNSPLNFCCFSNITYGPKFACKSHICKIVWTKHRNYNICTAKCVNVSLCLSVCDMYIHFPKIYLNNICFGGCSSFVLLLVFHDKNMRWQFTLEHGKNSVLWKQ